MDTTRLEEIKNELFDMANDLAGDATGFEASAIHVSVSTLMRVIKSLKGEEPLNPHDIAAQVGKWAFDVELFKSLS